MTDINKMKPVIIIPAFNPDMDVLTALVEKVRTFDVERVIVVNDGSREKDLPAFESLACEPQVKVLYHSENLGKGAALKTGFSHLLKYRIPCSGVITMDADGQHLPEDVERIVSQSAQTPDAFILGVRQFKEAVPLKSLLGNRITYLMFRGLTGRSVSDTQTGLRAIPAGYLEKVCSLDSDRYAYELEMLLTLIQDEVPVVEVPIKTVYVDNNAMTSFRPIADSYLIYRTLFVWWFAFRFRQLLKYALSGGFSTIADFGSYILLINLSCGFVTASVLARVLSTLVHFSSNKYFTFSYRDAPKMSEVGKYLVVVAFNLCSSILLIYLFITYFSLGEVIAKVVAQLLLFFATYTLLNGYVFFRSRRK